MVTVPASEQQQRADRVVADAVGLSRTYVQRLIEEGRLTVGGEPVKSNTMLEAGTSLELDMPDRPTPTIEAEDIPLASSTRMPTC